MMDAMSLDHALDPGLLAILTCPACRAGLTENPAAGELECAGCGRAYAVRDGIPVLLVDDARLPAEPGHAIGTD